MRAGRDPLLYQINTRVCLRELGRTLGHGATLDDIRDAELDRIARLGFDWIWLLGVWQTGVAGRELARAHQAQYRGVLPDLQDEDICGSCFAITGYTVHPALGGDDALARLRQRLRERGLRLMLDFVPNHTALDHSWVTEHPDYYVHGTEDDLARDPQNYYRAAAPLLLPSNPPPQGGREQDAAIMAHGRDPYFPGWTDTLQLNYGNPALQETMRAELLRIAGQCDGVRCDMAMLLLPEVFGRTWGVTAAPFWPDAIGQVHGEYPDFTFLAEVYWGLEVELQRQGFDYTYDKGLYDLLRDQQAGPVRDHLLADLDVQEKSARFLENHDEPRAAATFPPAVHEAAAIVAYLTPGLRFFHQGQLVGRRIRLPVQLCRAPDEMTDHAIQDFYARLLACIRQPAMREGSWQLLECLPAWDGNGTSASFIAFTWAGPNGSQILVAVNYAPNQSQCYVRWPVDDRRRPSLRLYDLMSSASYVREVDELARTGLYLDLPAWGYHVFEIRPD